MQFAEVESRLEAGGVEDVVGVEGNAEKTGVWPVEAVDARRKAGVYARGRRSAQSRHFAVD